MTELVAPSGVFAPAIATALDAALARLAGVIGTVEEQVVGWATVDLERASSGPGAADAGFRDASPRDEPLLGARGVVGSATPDRPAVILLEPTTEGRLAASLARHDEGPLVLYLLVAPGTLDRFRVVATASGVHVSRPEQGPFGPAVLVLDGDPWGPHLIVTAARARGTIER